MGLLRLLILFLVITFSSQVSAAIYYVKNGGNDELAGTSDATAWATISKVVATVTSGDTVYFRSQDTWEGSTPVLSATDGVTYDGSSYGTGRRATLRATAGYASNVLGLVNIAKSGVTFRGFEVDGNQYMTGGVYVGFSMLTGNISNINIIDCVVHDVGDPGTPDSWMYGILVGPKYGTGTTISNVNILNCTIYNTYHEGIAIYPSWNNQSMKNDTVTIRGCTIYDTGTIGSGGIGIAVINDSDNVTLEANNIYNSDTGIWLRTSSVGEGSTTVISAANNLIVKGNSIHDNREYGISISDFLNLNMTASFYGNVVYNNGKSGYAEGADLYVGSANFNGSVISFYNNTFAAISSAATTQRCVSFWTPITGSPTFNFRNNIVYIGSYGNTRPAIIDYDGILTHAYNSYFNAYGAAANAITAGGVNYTRSQVTTWEATAQNTDPAFLETTYFSINSSSPAYGTGTYLNGVSGYGGVLLNLSSVNIGAWQDRWYNEAAGVSFGR